MGTASSRIPMTERCGSGTQEPATPARARRSYGRGQGRGGSIRWLPRDVGLIGRDATARNFGEQSICTRSEAIRATSEPWRSRPTAAVRSRLRTTRMRVRDLERGQTLRMLKGHMDPVQTGAMTRAISPRALSGGGVASGCGKKLKKEER
jgi:hypothetical protein